MKHLLLPTLLCLAFLFLGSSCNKEDAADAFIGYYNVRLTQNVNWDNK